MKKIDELFKEWQSLQPLKESDQRRLDQKFMLEFNYNSNGKYSHLWPDRISSDVWPSCG